MHCRKKWNPEFTKASLNASFMQKEYRDHRKTILVDRTISQIQEYYPGAIIISQRRKDNVEIGKIQSEIDLLQQQINEKHNQIGAIRRKTNAAENASEGAGERRKFIMPCQTGGCRGMLSTAYKCELCEKFTCSKCLESIEGDKDAHECVQANVETAEEIRKNTRPCPNCGCRISKIDGCDQMWCIECKTAFSWSKGTVEVGIVHNPHYFQWMRQNGGMPGVPGGGCNENRMNTQLSFIRDFFSMLEKSVTYENDFMENCKKCGYTMDELKHIMPLVYENHNVIKKTKECEELERAKRVFSSSFFVNFHRFIIHTEHVTLRDLNDKIRFRNNENYPIHMYILGEESREELSDFLVKRDIANARDISQRDIVEACVMVGKQILTDLHTELSSMEIDFSWRLIYDQLVAMRFSRTNTSLDYVKDKMVEFSRFYAVFFKPHKESIENLYRLCSVITNKYMRAINQYSAYSNTEMVKHLILHNSKKQLYMWDSDVENAHIFKYDCKESLTNGVERFRCEFEKYENNVL